MKKNKKKEEKELLENVDAADTKEVLEKQEEEKKEKKPSKIKKPKRWENFTVYKFVIEVIATILLIILGVVMLINKDKAIGSIYILTAGVTILIDLFRVIILIKRKKDRTAISKRIILIEMLIEFIISVMLIFGSIAVFAIEGGNGNEFLVNTKNHFNQFYTLYTAGILYVAAMSYFTRVIYCKDVTSNLIFAFNFVFITGAIVLCIFRNDLTTSVIAMIIVALSFISAIIVGTDAGGGFYNYHKSLVSKKEENKEKENEIEAPAKDNDKEIIDPATIPSNDNNNNDSDTIVN